MPDNHGLVDPVVLVAVAPELARVMLEEDGYQILANTRVRIEPTDAYERARTGATYTMVFSRLDAARL